MMKSLPTKDLYEIKEIATAMKGKNVLISGSNGFIGSWIKEALKNICEVKAVDIENGFDITDTNRTLLMSGGPFHFIIHAAGFASPKIYKKKPLETISVAINGTRNLLKLAKNHKARMIFFSSSEVYGNPTEIPTPEWDVGRVAFRGPRACYDESKRLAETICEVYSEIYQTQVVTVRPFNVYGPGMSLDDGRAVAAFSKAAILNSPIEVFGNGMQTRTYCYITDAIRGFLLALQFGQAGRVYNIGAKEPEISAADLAKKIIKISNSKSEIIVRGDVPQDYPSDEPLRRCPDIRRAISELGYQPKVGLKHGLKAYLDWAASND